MGGARAAILAAHRADMDDRGAIAPASAAAGKSAPPGTGPLRLVSRIESQSASADLIEIGGLVDPGIVDQDRNRSEGARPAVAAASMLARSVTSIFTAWARRPLALICGDNRVGFARAFAIGEKHIGAGLGQAKRDGAADARGCRP